MTTDKDILQLPSLSIHALVSLNPQVNYEPENPYDALCKVNLESSTGHSSEAVVRWSPCLPNSTAEPKSNTIIQHRTTDKTQASAPSLRREREGDSKGKLTPHI